MKLDMEYVLMKGKLLPFLTVLPFNDIDEAVVYILRRAEPPAF
jgi:hypothetical protein